MLIGLILTENGGEGGIRTLDTLARMLVFKTSAFNHSATSPAFGQLTELVSKFQG